LLFLLRGLLENRVKGSEDKVEVFFLLIAVETQECSLLCGQSREALFEDGGALSKI